MAFISLCKKRSGNRSNIHMPFSFGLYIARVLLSCRPLPSIFQYRSFQCLHKVRPPSMLVRSLILGVPKKNDNGGFDTSYTLKREG